MNDFLVCVGIGAIVTAVMREGLMFLHPEATLESLYPLLVAIGGVTGASWGVYQAK